MRKAIILQARLSSSRLPRKVLADLSGKPMIAHIIERLQASRLADEVCVAIPADEREDELARVLAGMPVTVVRGSQHDVLGRYIQAAYETRADVIVRTTADNPLVSFAEIDRQLAEIEDEPGTEYLITEGYPLGITPETFTLKTLEKLDYLARHAHMREHVTLYIRRNSGPFAARALSPPAGLAAPELRLTVDAEPDLNLFRAIYNQLYVPGKLVDVGEAIELVRTRPDLRELALIPAELRATA
jgi:spore coat polysaccharide biosynthesis protein SpsF